MRSNGATKRKATKASNEISSSRFQSSLSELESAEAGHGTTTTFSNGKSHGTNGYYPTSNIIEGSPRQQRRRGIGRKKGGTLLRLKTQLRRKPYLAKQLLVCAVATFLIVFWVLTVVTATVHQQQEDRSQTTHSLPLHPARQQNEIEMTDSEPRTQQQIIPRENKKLPRATKTKTAFFATLDEPQFIPKFDIIFQKATTTTVDPNGVAVPDDLEDSDALEGEYGDYADLEMEFFEEEGAVRQIFHDYEAYETEYRPPDKPADDDQERYYAFDDDYERSHYTAYNDEGSIDDSKRCRRISEHRLSLQNCNIAHELALLDSNVKYLSAGAYRQVLVVDHSFSNSSEKIIVKDLHYQSDIQYDNFEFVRMDAIVAERLTASPRIFDIYGLCGLSILSEFFPHGDLEEAAVPGGKGYRKEKDMHDKIDVNPQNDLTAIEKLSIATQMAEALVDLHGYVNGVITHDDVQLAQYLFTADRSIIKLNDFNRAEFMLWDDKNDEYCKYKNGHGHGNWRSPEEYVDGPLDEKIDVWSVGNNFYSLLTGLWPFYDEEDDKKMKKRVIKGETAYIDPRYRSRSLAEGFLVQAIEKCFVFEPEKRASIFEVARFLRESLTQVEAAA